MPSHSPHTPSVREHSLFKKIGKYIKIKYLMAKIYLKYTVQYLLNLKFTYLKYTVQYLLLHSEFCNHYHNQF